MPKKRGLDNLLIQGGLDKKEGVVFLRGFDTPMSTMSLCAFLLIFCVQVGRNGRKRKFKTKSKRVNGMQDSIYIMKCFLIVQCFLDFFFD